jgi:FkbM family methyltransferase
MKTDKLISKNQPANWFNIIVSECLQEYPMHLVEIEPTEQVVDAGCNVGGFSHAFSNKFHNILAIDASSYNVEQYQNTHKHTTLHRAFYSKDNEIVQLKKYMGDGDNDTSSGNFSITGFINPINQHGFRDEEYEEVVSISLESIIEMVGDIGLLKIDIEGAEWDALYGKDLTRIKYIVGEFHNFLGIQKQNELFNWIGGTHEEIYSVGNGIDSHYIKLWKRK